MKVASKAAGASSGQSALVPAPASPATGAAASSSESVMVTEDKIYLLSDLRKSLCSDSIDRLNCQFFINFFGNDFLPEMLNTIDLSYSYGLFQRATTKPGSEKLILTNNRGLFNPEAFISFLTNIDEFSFYFRTNPTNVRDVHQFNELYPSKPVINEEDIQTTRETKLNFKRYYYSNLIRLETHNPNITSSYTDTQLYDFEMKIAFAYLKVYIWYFYYSNGYYIELPDRTSYDPFYRFNFPPLFNSLKKILMNPKLIIDIDDRYGIKSLEDLLNLRVSRRTIDYYATIPRYPSHIPQMLTVLQMKEALLIAPANNQQVSAIMTVRQQFELMYPVDPEKSLFIKTRLLQRIELTPTELQNAPPRNKYTYRLENMGTKVYPKFDLSLVMRGISSVLGFTLSSERIEPMTIGTVEHVDIVETRDSNFSCEPEELEL